MNKSTITTGRLSLQDPNLQNTSRTSLSTAKMITNTAMTTYYIKLFKDRECYFDGDPLDQTGTPLLSRRALYLMWEVASSIARKLRGREYPDAHVVEVPSELSTQMARQLEILADRDSCVRENEILRKERDELQAENEKLGEQIANTWGSLPVFCCHQDDELHNSVEKLAAAYKTMSTAHADLDIMLEAVQKIIGDELDLPYENDSHREILRRRLRDLISGNKLAERRQVAICKLIEERDRANLQYQIQLEDNDKLSKMVKELKAKQAPTADAEIGVMLNSMQAHSSCINGQVGRWHKVAENLVIEVLALRKKLSTMRVIVGRAHSDFHEADLAE